MCRYCVDIWHRSTYHTLSILSVLIVDNYLGRYSLNIFLLFFALKYVSSRCIIIVADVTTEQVSCVDIGHCDHILWAYSGRLCSCSADITSAGCKLCSVDMLRLGWG